MVLDLLFDVDLVEAQVRPTDVRALTRRLWMLAENSAEEQGAVRPPLVRLVWGKTWNVPGVIVAVAERFDAFAADGTPRRSWLRMKLARVTESAAAARESFEAELVRAQAQQATAATLPGQAGPSGATAVEAVGDGRVEPGYTGVRFDLLATDGLGSPFLWRQLAEHNDVANPLQVPPGTVLAVPPASGAGASAAFRRAAMISSAVAVVDVQVDGRSLDADVRRRVVSVRVASRFVPADAVRVHVRDRAGRGGRARGLPVGGSGRRSRSAANPTCSSTARSPPSRWCTAPTARRSSGSGPTTCCTGCASGRRCACSSP